MIGSDSRRYVVLGADGFIGSAVVRAALSAGAYVTAVCIRDPWRLADLESSKLVRVASAGYQDPGFAGQLEGVIPGADAIIHLGYQPPPSSLDLAAKESYERSVNTRMAAVVADVAGDVPIVFASSADVYGSWNDNPVNEDTLPNPATPYAEAKLEAETALGNRSTVLRVSTVFGPGELVPRAVPSFIKACLSGGTAVLHGDGRDVKDYVPLDAVAQAFVAAAAAPGENRRRIFNISSGVGRSTAEVLDAVVRVAGKAPVVENVAGTRQPSRLVVLADRARASLNFDPDTSFEAGLAVEAAWLDANRVRWE